GGMVVDQVRRAGERTDRSGIYPARRRSPGLDRPTSSREPRRGAGVSVDSRAQAAASDPVLRVRDLAVRFDSRQGVVHAVNGVSFDLEAGGALGLVGESGSGKSVTSLAILRLLPRPAAKIVSGEIWLGGRDPIRLSDREMRRVRGKEISLVPQDPLSGLNPVLTVGEQVVETLRAHEDMRRREARHRAAELLGMVGIPRPSDQLDRYPHQFSGGMR